MIAQQRIAYVFRVAAMVVFILTAMDLWSQEAKITRLNVIKKDGQADGKVMATVLGPKKINRKIVIKESTGSIANHAVRAWIIMDGQDALLLLSPEKKEQQYRLRYYQLDSGKSRLLGTVPFADATLAELKSPHVWAFAIAGIDPSTKEPAVFAGDENSLHSKLNNASDPHFSGNSFSFQSSGEVKTLPTTNLLGWQTRNRIYASSKERGQTEYLQFLPNGDSIATTLDGQVQHGQWLTDGTSFHITSTSGTGTVWNLSDLQIIAGVPAESRLTVRLLEPLSSRTSRKGMNVNAVLISPGVYESSILIPQGSKFSGTVIDAHGVGLGIRHETAALTVHFESVKLPDGRMLPIDARVIKVENSREEVTSNGKIQGIRSTGTIGHTAENQINSLAQIDPIGYLFTSTSGPAVLGFAEPEILYNAGTELDIEFNKPVITAQKYESRVPHMPISEDQANQFSAMVKDLPFRTQTETGHQPSDITNLIFIGTPDALHRALEAAGWTSADSLTAAATFQTVKTLSGNQTYTQAPMSVLMLGDKKPIFTMQKTTNTFSSRHHLRIFETGQTFDGQPVLTASSTQDIGIAFSYKQKTFIHVIDQYLDNERSKVVNDIEFTGCVKSIDMVSRPWVPQDAYNSTGDRLRTDGDAAVLQLDQCASPYTTPVTPAKRAPLLERSERNTMLSIKDTLYRGNLIYTGISGGIKVHHYLATQGELGEDTGNWRKNDASGTEYRVAPTAGQFPSGRIGLNGKLSPESQRELDAASRALIAAHKWDPPHYEIALNLGYSNYRNNILETTVVDLSSTDPNKPEYLLGLSDAVFDGWAAGISLTLNSWNWISNEFSYMRQQTKFDLVAITVSSDPQQEPPLDVQTVGLATRRFTYNTVFNLRPRKSRWRPYITAGPAFQLLALSNAPLKKPAGYFRLGLSNIGLLKAAFDFGNTPPLDGGGIFQFGLQYGAGMKYRVTPRFTVRGDYGETWSANPKIIRDSYLGYIPDGVDDTYSTKVTNVQPSGKFIQQRSTIGFAFTF
jgi:opacity protein-like surface antigen